MPSTTVIHSARIVSGGSMTTDGWVEFERDRITAVGTGNAWRNRAKAAEVFDAAGRLLAPGFIDMHGHGGGGAAFDEGPSAARTALATHRAHGTTRSVLSLVTGGLTAMVERIHALTSLVRDDPLVLGLHLEGPFLAASFRGAHDPVLLRQPDPASVTALLDAAENTVCQVTLASDLPGAGLAIEQFLAAGVRIAVGHTGADFDQALTAFSDGASILTHAFNGMPDIHHRAPGPVMAAVQSRQVVLEVIADGVHVHPALIALLFRQAPGRVALITDAMAATGAPDGDYLLGSLPVTVRDGVARTQAGGLAGSTLTQDKALRVAVQDAGVPLPDAVEALTHVPATALGLDKELGRLSAGFFADAVLLDDDLQVSAVWANGQRYL